MTRAILLLLLACATASAAPVKPPAGWTGDPQAAVSLSQQLGALPHFGGLRSVATTEAYRAPAGGALFVTRLVANVSALDEAGRNRAATAELGELAATVARAGATATSDGGATKAIADAKLLEATHKWHDTATGVVVTSRMVIASDNQQMVAVIGECVLASDAAPDVVTPCTGALASLDPDLNPASRVVLAIAAAAPSMQPPATGSSGPSLIDSGDRPSLPPMSIPQERETDRRPIYVGIGLVVLAAIFWWNRKQRAKLEKDYEERNDVEESKPKPDRGGDADDLHAAAEEPDEEIARAAKGAKNQAEKPAADKADDKTPAADKADDKSETASKDGTKETA